MIVPTRIVRTRAARLTAALALALTSACASASGGGASGGAAGSAPSGQTSSRDILDATGLQASSASNLYEAIQQLRPELLNAHHLGVPDVYIGRVKQSRGLERLKELTTTAVAEVRYLPYSAAQSLPGEQSEAGALVVTLK